MSSLCSSALLKLSLSAPAAPTALEGTVPSLALPSASKISGVSGGRLEASRARAAAHHLRLRSLSAWHSLRGSQGACRTATSTCSHGALTATRRKRSSAEVVQKCSAAKNFASPSTVA